MEHQLDTCVGKKCFLNLTYGGSLGILLICEDGYNPEVGCEVVGYYPGNRFPLKVQWIDSRKSPWKTESTNRSNFRFVALHEVRWADD
jgi:hypothetical protein